MTTEYTDTAGFRRVVTDYGPCGGVVEKIHGFVFSPYPRGEQGAFGGSHRDCTPDFSDRGAGGATPDEAMEIAVSRGESSQTGHVVPAVRSTFGPWSPEVMD